MNLGKMSGNQLVANAAHLNKVSLWIVTKKSDPSVWLLQVDELSSISPCYVKHVSDVLNKRKGEKKRKRKKGRIVKSFLMEMYECMNACYFWIYKNK